MVRDAVECPAVGAREHALSELRRVGTRLCAALDGWLAQVGPLDVIARQIALCRAQLAEATGPLAGLDDAPAMPVEDQLARLEVALAAQRDAAGARGAILPLVRLVAQAELTRFELDALLLAALVEESSVWATLFSLLADSASVCRPRLDQALHAWTPSRGERARLEAELLEGALLRHGFVRLEPPEAPLAMRELRLTGELWKALCGLRTCEPLLAPSLRRAPAGAVEPVLPPELAAQVDELAALARAGEPLRIALVGAAGSGRHTIARHVAAAAGLPLVELRLPSAAPAPEWLAAATRHALVTGAALLLEAGDDAVELRGPLPRHAPCFVVASEACELRGATASELVRLPVPRPRLAERTRLWRALAADADLDAAELARRFAVTGGEIVASVGAARTLARLSAQPRPGVAELERALRDRPARKLDALVRRRAAHARWDDLVVSRLALGQLQEIAERVRHRDQVFDEWKVAAHTSRQTGTLALFVGPSGTGKTLAAEAIASQLGLDLYCVDLSQVVSKYVGETEKHLARLFDALDGAPAVLFFDEADGIFGKRTETRDAHDRYANLETSYLLSRLESFGGVAVLASNLRQNIDHAFLRRMDFVVEFALPDARARAEIWRRHLRNDAPRAPDLDPARLAELFPISGAQIRNVVVAAAFSAAAAGEPIAHAHVVAALRREYDKQGKPFPTSGGR